jgi:cytochrome c1
VNGQFLEIVLRGGSLAAIVVLLAACSSRQSAVVPVRSVVAGDPQAGVAAIQRYGCGTCHRIPGIAGADSLVGPPLDGWPERSYIAGSLPNQAEYLIQWIRYPQSIEPGNAMPDMGVSEEEARDISAYLYALPRE